MTPRRLMRLAVPAALLLAAACGDAPPPPQPATPAALVAHSNEFRRGVEPVRDGVWVAIGYGLANSILVEGNDGLIVIDTMASMDSARTVAREFRAISPTPLRAIIYTHNHADHVFGAQAFLEELAAPDIPVEIFAHATTADLVYRIVNVFRPIITARSFRMFGTHLEEAELINAGIGNRLEVTADSAFGFVPPTVSFTDTLDTEIAGIRFSLVHAAGETDDQLFAWFPELGLLAPGDNIYKTFPNLYTIRGTPYRSLRGWADSLDRMRDLPIEYLVPSHTRPLRGRDVIHHTLTDYRDAIRFVHDQTIRRINQGMTPDQIVAAVQLPAHLAASPWLQEFYGKVSWSARSVMTGNLGWFDGNPATLQPLPPEQRARKIAALAGGAAELVRVAQQALDDGEAQWALELSDLLLALDPTDQAAREMRADALFVLGAAEANPNARHYYFSSAREFRDGLRFAPLNRPTDEMLATIPLGNMFEALAVNLHAEDCLDRHQVVTFEFTDTPERWTVVIRRGVTEIRPELLPDPDLHVRVDSLAFKKLLAGTSQPLATLLMDFDFPTGNTLAFTNFISLFRGGDAPQPAPLAQPPD